ncbi:MAG: phosphate acyltransferase PlsX [Clostridiales bacterium]|nr:phosphate acyltransferase PlsX [Clostridiales bacterium]
MKLILDAMGGDNAPLEIIKGAAQAVAEYPDVELILVGIETTIREICEKEKISLERIEIMDAPDVVTMEDSAQTVVMSKKNSSMSIGLRALASGKGEAFISAGNTGALMTGATLLVRCVKGVKRAAIATILPMEKPVLMIDSGSNINVNAEYLMQFGILGSIYMEKVFEIDSPRVGLLNNGTEEHKGTAREVEAYELLKNTSGINFIGNVEGKGIPFGACDVLVTDGFTGNIVLKTIEGLSKFMMKKLKGIFMKNFVNKLSALIIKKEFSTLKKSFDASEYGGAPFLGISKPVFKAHGSSDARAIKNAVRQAREYVVKGVPAIIDERIAASIAENKTKIQANKAAVADEKVEKEVDADGKASARA